MLSKHDREGHRKAKSGGKKVFDFAPEPDEPTTHVNAFDSIDLRHSLASWAARYLAEKVYGVQSPSTVEAKTRDLAGFVRWFVAANGHGHIESWSPSDTQMYLGGLKEQGRAPATINRVLATLRHFARWVHEHPGALFRKHGLPTRGVEALAVPLSGVAPLNEMEVRALFDAADIRVCNDMRKNARPRRNKAILSMLFLTGLRVSELLALHREQFTEGYLANVPRKGRKRVQRVYLVAECQAALQDYLDRERVLDDPAGDAEPMFLPSNKTEFMTRQQIGKILDQLAKDASASYASGINVHPTRLRHTFGFALHHMTESSAETAAALGHAGAQYAGRYALRSQVSSRETVLEEISEALVRSVR